jgi:hypothetical protein
MSNYLETTYITPFQTMLKDGELIDDGAIMINEPEKFEEGLVCLVANAGWTAAAVVRDQRDLERMRPHERDRRARLWFKYPKIREACALTGFNYDEYIS